MEPVIDITPLPESLNDEENLSLHLSQSTIDFFITLEFGRNIDRQSAELSVIKFCEQIHKAFSQSNFVYFPDYEAINGFAMAYCSDNEVKYHLLLECTEPRLFYLIAPRVWSLIEKRGTVHFCKLAEQLYQPFEERYCRIDQVLSSAPISIIHADYIKLLVRCLWSSSRPESSFFFGCPQTFDLKGAAILEATRQGDSCPDV